MSHTDEIRVRVLGGDGLRERVAAIPGVETVDAGAAGDTDDGSGDGDATADPADCAASDDPGRVDAVLPTVVVADDLDDVPGAVSGFVRADAPTVHLADQLRLAARRTRPAVGSKAERLHDVFDEHDRELAELLMSHVGESVDRQRTESELRQRNRTIEDLHGVATGLVSCRSEAALYDRMVEAAAAVLDFEVCVVLVATPADGVPEADGPPGDVLEITATSGESLAPPEGRTVSTDAGLVGETYRTGEPVLVRDVADEERAEPYADAYRSALSVPFGSVGVVQAIDDDPDAYDERDLDLLELFVSQAAAAVSRIRAEEELRAERDRLREFASVVSHDLRSPLNVAQGYVELAAERETADYLDPAAAALERMDALVDDVLELARQPTVEETATVDLAPLVRMAAHNVGLDGVDVTAPSFAVDADRDRLLRLLENLLRNALEHGSADGRRVTARVGPIRNGAATDPVGFYVADDGPGIPPEEREGVFDSGHTMTETGTGLGLAIVQSIAQAHGWTASVTESESGGARFEIRTG